MSHALTVRPHEIKKDMANYPGSHKFLQLIVTLTLEDSKLRKSVKCMWVNDETEEQFKLLQRATLDNKLTEMGIGAGGDKNVSRWQSPVELKFFKGQKNAQLIIGPINDHTIDLTFVIDPGHIRLPFKMVTDAGVWVQVTSPMMGKFIGKA